MKKPKSKTFKIISVLLALVVVIGIYALSINFYIVLSQDNKIKPEDNVGTGYDCIFILGCGVKEDGTPSDMLKDRLETGINLYKRGVAPVIIMSGDHGTEGYDEVNVMKNVAVAAGVPADKIFLDHAGFNTYESMYRAKEIFGVETAVIVTQEYHLYRALYDAENFGIKAVGVSATLHNYNGQFVRDIREIIARNKDFLWCIFEPKPTYLGEKIDLNGDGNLTNG